MYIYPLSHRQYVYVMLMARTSNEITTIIMRDLYSRCNAKGYMRKGKGRPVSKNKHDRTTNLYTHIYKIEHNYEYTRTYFFTLLFILPSTGFEPGFPASLLSPITTTLYYLLLLQLLK